MRSFIRRHWGSSAILGIAAASLIGLVIVDTGPQALDSVQAYAVAHNAVPTDTMACKTALSCARSAKQKELQHELSAKQKAEMKAFQAQQRARDKALLAPQRKAIQHNPDLSKNQQKAMLKQLAAQQKMIDHQETADFKAQQKAEAVIVKQNIKQELKNMFG